MTCESPSEKATLHRDEKRVFFLPNLQELCPVQQQLRFPSALEKHHEDDLRDITAFQLPPETGQ